MGIYRSKSVGSSSSANRQQRGMALILVLLTLLLLSAIGLGLMYMSDTETAVNSNYRDTQLAFFAMRAGLEEARDRMRSNSVSPLTLPTTMPGSANSIVYITDPAAGENVDPTNTSNAYLDDEFCHETFSGLSLSNPGVNVPCSATPPSSSVAAYVNSFSPNTGTAAALKYKWVRITLKQNGTISGATVDGSQPASTQVCFQTAANQEIPVSLIPGGPYASCSAAQAAGKDASPVYLVTSLAVTPQGSRRIGQYEVAGLNFTPPPGALGLDGPGATFSPRPSSNNYFINGNDNASSGWGTVPAPSAACVSSGPAQVPAVATGDAAGATTITTAITANPDRSSKYTGSGATPSVVNSGPTGTGLYGGQWSSPAQLDNLVNGLANAADVTYSCGIGAACSPSGPVGTNSNPQITYVDGDFNFGNGSGAGVLVVTGTLSFNGNASFNGLVLVIGQGVATESGGGNGGFNGSMFVAKTRSSVAPYDELATLGSPTYSWNGGGNSDIQYNSCWANIGSTMRYRVVATREEMY
jgi:Tfp pilus assembly protein PilV